MEKEGLAIVFTNKKFRSASIRKAYFEKGNLTTTCLLRGRLKSIKHQRATKHESGIVLTRDTSISHTDALQRLPIPAKMVVCDRVHFFFHSPYNQGSSFLSPSGRWSWSYTNPGVRYSSRPCSMLTTNPADPHDF